MRFFISYTLLLKFSSHFMFYDKHLLCYMCDCDAIATTDSLKICVNDVKCQHYVGHCPLSLRYI
jgi:hypothetical protein